MKNMGKGRLIELTGRRFGMLTVLRRDGMTKVPRWLCRCDCGAEKAIAGVSLRRGWSRSCGCMGHHWMYGTPEYGAWSSMKDRCRNPNCRNYPNYGGRGITICEKWETNFLAFFEDMGARPSAAHSLDRINNDGNYEPGNCRWTTSLEQARNKRSNHLLTVGEETLTISAWAQRTGLGKTTIKQRLVRGWDALRAVTLPPMQ